MYPVRAFNSPYMMSIRKDTSRLENLQLEMTKFNSLDIVNLSDTALFHFQNFCLSWE
jgi:hypothetical protein